MSTWTQVRVSIRERFNAPPTENWREWAKPRTRGAPAPGAKRRKPSRLRLRPASEGQNLAKPDSKQSKSPRHEAQLTSPGTHPSSSNTRLTVIRHAPNRHPRESGNPERLSKVYFLNHRVHREHREGNVMRGLDPRFHDFGCVGY